MEVSIGADPEFAAVTAATGRAEWGEVGFDGAGHPTFEIRPNAEWDVGALVENIRQLLQIAANADAPPAGYAGPFALGRPLGGHIHIGSPLLLSDMDRLDGVIVSLGNLLYPMLAIAGGRRNKERRESEYGAPYSARRKRHGVEWRAPFSWLWDPNLARAVLQLTRIVTMTVLQKGPVNDVELRNNTVIADAILQQQENFQYDKRMIQLAATARSRLIEFVGNPVLSREVDWCCDVLMQNKRNEYDNIFHNWQLSPVVNVPFKSRCRDAIKEMCYELAMRTGAYYVMVYKFGAILDSSTCYCSGLEFPTVPPGWACGGRRGFELVPTGAIAIGFTATMIDLETDDETVLERMRALLASPCCLRGNDQARYKEDEYELEDEERSYWEEPDWDEELWQEPNMRPTALIAEGGWKW